MPIKIHKIPNNTVEYYSSKNDRFELLDVSHLLENIEKEIKKHTRGAYDERKLAILVNNIDELIDKDILRHHKIDEDEKNIVKNSIIQAIFPRFKIGNVTKEKISKSVSTYKVGFSRLIDELMKYRNIIRLDYMYCSMSRNSDELKKVEKLAKKLDSLLYSLIVEFKKPNDQNASANISPNVRAYYDKILDLKDSNLHNKFYSIKANSYADFFKQVKKIAKSDLSGKLPAEPSDQEIGNSSNGLSFLPGWSIFPGIFHNKGKNKSKKKKKGKK